MEDKQLEYSIRNILLKEWDPNCVGDNIHLRDEYDPFIPEILKAILGGVGIHELEAILERDEVAQESSALPENRKSAARSLAQLRDQKAGG